MNLDAQAEKAEQRKKRFAAANAEMAPAAAAAGAGGASATADDLEAKRKVGNMSHLVGRLSSLLPFMSNLMCYSSCACLCIYLLTLSSLKCAQARAARFGAAA